MTNRLLLGLVHQIIRTRQWKESLIKEHAKTCYGRKILEIGSGDKRIKWRYHSLKKYYVTTDLSNTFVQSDIDESYGQIVKDITTMQDDEEWDVILCTSVLEHVYDFQKGIDNMYRAIKQYGELVLFVPAYYPLHDEPHDYWRFTEHALRKMLKQFDYVTIESCGLRRYPFAYFVKAMKIEK